MGILKIFELDRLHGAVFADRKGVEIARSEYSAITQHNTVSVTPGASIVTKGIGSITLRRLYIHKAMTHVFYELKPF